MTVTLTELDLYANSNSNLMLTTAPLLTVDDGAVHEDDGAARHEDDGAVAEARRRLTFSSLLIQEQRKRG